MKKKTKWVLGAFLGLVAVSAIQEAVKSPEQKAAEAEQARQNAAERLAKAEQESAREALEQIVEPARQILELAYIRHIKDQGATHVSCSEAELDGRFFVRCGIGYGSPQTVKNGVWEAASLDQKLALYAMNGDALRALDKIGSSEEFRSGAGHRPPVDIAAIFGSDGTAE